MPTPTTNFAFNKPLVNDPIDEDIWGGQLNDNWDSVDAILPVPAASKFGALVVQSTNDTGYEILSGQGNSGDTLQSTGPDTLPAFGLPGGDWTLLETQTASNDTSIDFTSNIDGTSNVFAITISNALPATDLADFLLRVSTDGGSSFDAGASDYEYHTMLQSSNSDSYAGQGTAGSSRILLGETINSVASKGGFSGTIFMYAPNNSAVFTHFTWQGMTPTSSRMQFASGAGARFAASDVDAIRFIMNTGNIVSGIFKLYRIN